MADEDLRRSERDRDLLGSDQARARHFHEQLRAGRVEPGRLALLSQLGWAPAVLVTGPGEATPAALIAALRAMGIETCLRATCPILRLVRPGLAGALPGIAGGEDVVDPARVDELVAAVEAFVACPCAEHAEEASGQGAVAIDAASFLIDEASDRPEAAWCARAFHAIAGVLQGPVDLWPAWPPGSGRTAWVCELIEAALERVDLDELRAALGVELLPWLLERG